jgi:ketosteroid isomerase-like protein
MSQENVEIVRRAYEAFNQGDLEGMVASFAPDFEFVASGAIPGVDGVYRGPEEYKRRIVEQFGDEFHDFGADIHEFIEAGDQVLVSQTFRGRGKQSGVETRWNIWQVWTVRNGSIVHGQGFTSRAQALEAAGLRE